MTNPMSLVPLDKLIKIEQNLHLAWRYDCQLADHVGVYEYGSREAATAAGMEHLARVHGIRPMSLLDNLTPEHATHIKGLIAERDALKARVAQLEEHRKSDGC